MNGKPGTYVASVIEAGIAKSKNGTPQAVIQFSYDDDGTPRKITGYFALTEKAIDHTVDKLFNAGFRGKSISNLGDPASWTGRQCEIVLNEETYENKKVLRVSYVNEPGANKFNFIPPTQVQAELGHLDVVLGAFAAKKNIKLGTQDYSLEDDVDGAAV